MSPMRLNPEYLDPRAAARCKRTTRVSVDIPRCLGSEQAICGFQSEAGDGGVEFKLFKIVTFGYKSMDHSGRALLAPRDCLATRT
jgi:hypothetical protein